MQALSVDEVRRLQLDLLDDFIAICEDLNLRWFIGFGTLLGAVRHGGYIPWDDDIDVAMPRSDYERFCRETEWWGSDRGLASLHTDATYPFPYAKFYDTSTRTYEPYHPMPNYGVNIDIFPIDKFAGKFYIGQIKRRLGLLLNLTLYIRLSTKLPGRGLLMRQVFRLAKMCLLPIPPRVIGGLLSMLSFSDQELSGKRAGMLCWGTRIHVPAEYFSTHVVKCFEGREVNVPVGWHEWLTALYGNYMSLPPISERRSHHSYLAVWKRGAG